MIAWLGLGTIGLPMAARLVKAGFEVRGYDIDAGRRSAAAARGIAITEKLEGAELLFTSMPTEQALLDLVKD